MCEKSFYMRMMKTSATKTPAGRELSVDFDIGKHFHCCSLHFQVQPSVKKTFPSIISHLNRTLQKMDCPNLFHSVSIRIQKALYG